MSNQLRIPIYPKPDFSSFDFTKFIKEEHLVVAYPSLLKTIRLAKELAEQDGPMLLDHNDHVRAILHTPHITDTLIESVKPIEEPILIRVVLDIVSESDRYIFITKKVREL